MAKAFDPKAKAKRQKIIAGVLGLVLVGVLVFQAPTIMSMFGGGSSTTASEPAGTPPPAPAAPAPATPGAPAPSTPPPAVPGGTAALVDSDPTPTPTDGQLVTFDRFESKDPFAQQIQDAAATPTAAPGTPAVAGDKPKAPAAQPAPSPAKKVAAAPKAQLSVNGVAQGVQVKMTFPKDEPMFQLVSLKGGVAKVGIVGGSYANGSQTITLNKGGKPVTLMNTADGTTFVLRYLG